jgi:HK97 family phage major capsid protein
VENTNLTPEQVVEKIGSMFEEKSATFSTKEELDSHVSELNSQIEGLKGLEEKNADIEKAIARFEGRLESFNEKAQVMPTRKLGMAGTIMKTISDNIDKIKSAINNGQEVNLEVKDTTITNDYTGDIALTELDSQVDRLVRNRKGILDIVSRGSTSSKFITYIQQTQGSRTAWTLEAGEKLEGEPAWEEVTEEVKKIAGYVKVSKEMLDDLSFIRSEINLDLMEKLRTDIENSLLNGSGLLGVINGLLSVPMGLPAFNPGSFAVSIPNANITDLIRVIKAQIESANQSPTHAIMHPQDIAALQLTKGSDNTYTYPMYLPNGEEVMRVAGISIVSSTFIAQGTMLVGDMSKVNVKFRENMNMSVGLDRDDFTRNMITILVEARLVQYVKANQKTAFVVSDIDADITAIDAP